MKKICAFLILGLLVLGIFPFVSTGSVCKTTCSRRTGECVEVCEEEPTKCVQVITPAFNPNVKPNELECTYFSNPCVVPHGWIRTGYDCEYNKLMMLKQWIHYRKGNK